MTDTLLEMEKRSSTVQAISSELQYIFNDNSPFVATIKGKWGTGKTSFWNAFKDAHLTDSRYAYVSLFGKTSIDDIRRDVLLQISVKNRTLSTVKEKINDIKGTLGFKEDELSFGVSGAVLNSLMSLFEAKDFEDVVICFDDLERLSDRLPLKEVIGYISILKENFKCKIIILLNDEKMSKDDELYKDYKEKIVDFEFLFAPEVQYSLEIANKKLEKYQDIFSDYNHKIKVNNIRVLQRNVRFLNRLFSVFSKVNNLDQKYEKELVERALSLSTVYFEFSFTDWRELEKYSRQKAFSSVNPENFNENATFDTLLNYFEYSIYFILEKYDEYILDYLGSSILNENLFLEHISMLNSDKKTQNILDKFHNLDPIFHRNFQADKAEYIKELKSVINENGVIYLFNSSFDNLQFFISVLKELDSENKNTYIELSKKISQQFIDEVFIKRMNYKEFTDIYDRPIFDQIKLIHPELEDYINQKITTLLDIGYSFDKLNEMLDLIVKHHIGEEQIDFLNSASIEFYKNCMMTSPDIVRKIQWFLKDYQLNNSHFTPAITAIWKALDEIEQEDQNANGYKVRRIKYILNYHKEQEK